MQQQLFQAACHSTHRARIVIRKNSYRIRLSVFRNIAGITPDARNASAFQAGFSLQLRSFQEIAHRSFYPGLRQRGDKGIRNSRLGRHIDQQFSHKPSRHLICRSQAAARRSCGAERHSTPSFPNALSPPARRDRTKRSPHACAAGIAIPTVLTNASA